MFCSGSECSQVEHFRPKATFPHLAMEWGNLLWVCALCNLNKGDRFPNDWTGPLINPLTEDVWQFFMIDEYGNLTERWVPQLNGLNPRAQVTIRVLGLDRDALQMTRQARLVNLKHLVEGALSLFELQQLTAHHLRERIDLWLQEPFQPDVADYFLNGPGSVEQPFAQLLGKAGLTRPR